MPVFRHSVQLPHPVDTVFRWHGRPGAFQRLSPPWEDVEVLESSGGLEEGSRVVLSMKQGPARLRWEVEHVEYREGELFVDEQVKGPFRSWRHEHRFHAVDDTSSVLEDVVEWEAPMGGLGEAFGGAYIEKTLRRLFEFRGRRLREDLERAGQWGAEAAGGVRTVAITGSSGLIGTELRHFLTTLGHRVLRVTRDGRGDVRWDPAAGEIDSGALEGVDAVVHLAGEPIVGVRWTEAKKEAILRSRREGTRTLATALARLERKPKVLVSGSAVGWYGSRGDEPLGEADSPGEGFLADVTREWEKATSPARASGIRVVHLRTGIVLSPRGGVLGSVLLPFRLGVGGRLGSGKQYMPWIDLDDEVGLILHALTRGDVRGAMNATAPNPLPNAAFTDVLGRVLGRPTLLPVPALAIRSLLGQMGEELLLAGQRALPRVATETGYSFLRPDLEDSLRFQLGRFEHT
ncbi:MAG: TIGR01777 family protein [Gemmatimonadales bacterium]|nr:MAG: TIGR01777 family protein [Gemmatimonadales bacterium]